MRNISSGSLFHYTPRFENIKGIIEKGFNFNILEEPLPLKGFESSIFYGENIIEYKFEWFAICFCDLPLSVAKNHIEQYGKYCIGLTKTWGTKNGVTPIRYVHKDSPDLNDDFMLSLGSESYIDQPYKLIKMFAQAWKDTRWLDASFELSELDKLSENIKKFLLGLEDHIIGLQKYVVNSAGYWRIYSGTWEDRETKIKKEYVFYDEREWRAITDNPKNNLLFSFEDLTHIFVNNQREREELIGLIKYKEIQLEEKNISTKIHLWDEFLKDL